MKHLVVINGHACEGKALTHLQKVEEAFENLDAEIYLTEGPRSATKFVREFLDKHQDEHVRVYSCGGDGTLHEVVDGLYGHENADLALYPIGTGNDFTKAYGGKEKFTLEALQNGTSHPIDLSLIQGETLEFPMFSINVINFGFDAIVGAVGNKNKLKGKKDPYDKALVTAIFKGRFNKIDVEVDGEKITKKKMLLCTLAQGQYVGGKFRCAPKSDNTDGLIDVCLLHTRSLFAFLSILGPYTNGEHLDNPKYMKKIVYKRAKEIIVDGRGKDIDVCVDGEMVRGKHFKVTIIPNAIKFVIPE